MTEANENKKSLAVQDGDRKFTDLQSRVRTLENLCYSAKEVLNLEEAASFLGIAKSTLYKMTHENRIPFYKPAGKLIYFEKSVLLDWIRSNRVMSETELQEAARKKLLELNSRTDKTNPPMTQQKSVQMDSDLAKYVAELEKRVRNLEDKFDSGKEVLTLQEAAQYMGIARSSLYKMTSNQTIPFYRPNGKLIFFEKDDILSWIRRNRVFSTEEIEEEARLHMQRLSIKNKKD